MNIESEKALEFDAIRLLLVQCARTPMGRCLARNVTTVSDTDELQAELSRLSALRTMRHEEFELNFDSFSSIEPEAAALRNQKPVLEPLQLYIIAAAICEADANRQLLELETERFPALQTLSEKLDFEHPVTEEILQAVDDTGELLDDASPELTNMRASMRTIRKSINVELKKFFDGNKHPDFVQEEFITIRGGRMVIPIKIEHRNRAKGIVHDRSRSGDSLFFEPIEVVEVNNSLAQLQAEIKLEEARILAKLTASLYASWEQICACFETMASLDFLTAKSKLADIYDGVAPELAERGRLLMEDGRHPLLDERLANLREAAGIASSEPAGQPVVPVTVTLDDKTKVLVITGPNAGGKTVSMKTVGLLSLMAQAGMHIPARRFRGPIFKTIAADIGDYQDIISHLSSFSSHITWLKNLLGNLRLPALILIDEIAAATDPGEGSALAIATLEELRDAGAYVVISTHLEALKAFAHTESGMQNACVEFDPQTKLPTYKLAYGLPGTSNALETARDIGLPESLVSRAQTYLLGGESRISDIIAKLQRELAVLRKQNKDLEEERRALETARRHYVKRLDESEANQQKALKNIENEWRQFKLQQEKSLRETLEEAKKSASLEEARAAARQKRDELKTGYESLKFHRRKREPLLIDGGGALEKGDEVELLDLGQRAIVHRDWDPAGSQNVVVELRGKRLSLHRAGVAIRTKRGSITKRAKTELRVVAHARQPRSEIKIIGMNVDEALSEVEKFLDEALLLSVPKVRIIHGRGTGTLRTAIDEFLGGKNFVESWHPAHPAQGGDGVTEVDLSA